MLITNLVSIFHNHYKQSSEACHFVKKETLAQAQVFSCELCENSKYTFLDSTPLVVVSESHQNFFIHNFSFSIYPKLAQKSQILGFCKSTCNSLNSLCGANGPKIWWMNGLHSNLQLEINMTIKADLSTWEYCSPWDLIIILFRILTF